MEPEDEVKDEKMALEKFLSRIKSAITDGAMELCKARGDCTFTEAKKILYKEMCSNIETWL